MGVDTIGIILAILAGFFIMMGFPNNSPKENESLTEGKWRAVLERMAKLEARVDILQTENASLKGHIAILEARNKIANNDFGLKPLQNKEAIELVKEGELKEALQMLLAEEPDDERADSFIILISQLSRAERQALQGTIDPEDYERRLSSITSAVINLIDEN